MDDGCLVKSEGKDDYPDTTVSWVEYRLHRPECSSQISNTQALITDSVSDTCNCVGDDEIVHRSAHIEVKLGIISQAMAPDI
jgi:hypothetical protein